VTRLTTAPERAWQRAARLDTCWRRSSRQANIAQAPRVPGQGDDPSGTPPNDKAFLGETIDPAQAPTYLNARSTNTNTSRFIAVDPAVTKTRDPYIYSSGNPIRRSNPTGLWD